MKENIQISFKVERINDGCLSASQCSTPLEFDVFFDNEKIFSFDPLLTQQKFIKEIQNLRENEAYTLRFVMQNKSAEHTRINSQGVIQGDCRIKISDLRFNDIALEHTFFTHAKYMHNQNQVNRDIEAHKFYGEMGCNGEVRLTLTIPIYIWLLENL